MSDQQKIPAEVEEAQARLWEFIHNEDDPDVYDQANADLEVIYSALLGSVEQLEAARESMQKLVDVHANTYGEIDGDHLAEPFKDWLARYGSNPAIELPFCRCNGESCAIQFAPPEEAEEVRRHFRCRRESSPADEVAWLIERSQPEGEKWPLWLRTGGSWTRDALQARRFDTRREAENHLPRAEAHVVEHGFTSSPASEPKEDV